MIKKHVILVVDDDEDLRLSLMEQFDPHDEFTAVGAGTAREGIEKAQEGLADLVLLDVGLPDMDGREACKQMRKASVSVPILMLTGASTEVDQIYGLDAGANDYVVKPYKFNVLLARIRAHLRSHQQSEEAVFDIGPYSFQPSQKLLMHKDGGKVRLTEKETGILKYLYRAENKPVMRDELLHQVWGYNSSVTTHTLETHIYRLRQKIENNPTDARLLRTEPGGYRLVP